MATLLRELAACRLDEQSAGLQFAFAVHGPPAGRVATLVQSRRSLRRYGLFYLEISPSMMAYLQFHPQADSSTESIRG